MENLLHDCTWYNPMTAVTKDLKGYELDNIIIYSENGKLIETDCGWFGRGNNDLESIEIEPEILYKRKIDLTSKANFVVKSEQKPYKYDSKYTLYLYYKNINYKYNGIVLDSLFLTIEYTIFENYKSNMVIGDRYKKSDKIQYQEKFEEATKSIDRYSMHYRSEEFKKALKTLAKIQKDFEKARKEDDELTADDWEKVIRENDIDFYKNNESIKEA